MDPEEAAGIEHAVPVVDGEAVLKTTGEGFLVERLLIAKEEVAVLGVRERNDLGAVLGAVAVAFRLGQVEESDDALGAEEAVALDGLERGGVGHVVEVRCW